MELPPIEESKNFLCRLEINPKGIHCRLSEKGSIDYLVMRRREEIVELLVLLQNILDYCNRNDL